MADPTPDPKHFDDRSLATGYSTLVHRLAVILTVAVFPLIWVGGLVTTYDAGMAVPDWPGTYGWNMFAYPASTWLFGPFDLLVEHSHRLLGTLAGLLSIALVVAAFRNDRRPWFRRWTLLLLLAVIAQGALGGARVLLDERTVAMIHGCTGPLFFAMAAATAVMSSRWWIERSAEGGGSQAALGQNATGPFLCWLASALLVASYLQLIVGAQLRHVTGSVPHSLFKGFVHMHLGLAGLVALIASGLLLTCIFKGGLPARVRRTVFLVFAAVLLQIALGIGTWIVNYALPWAELNAWLASYTISAKGYWESLVVTAHVATGALIISLSTVVALRAWRSRATSTQVPAN